MLHRTLLLLSLILPISAGADPVDLHDATPRWIEVSFEVSPRSLPAQAASVYTVAIPAWIEPIDAGNNHCLMGLRFREITREHQDRIFQFVIRAHMI